MRWTGALLAPAALPALLGAQAAPRYVVDDSSVRQGRFTAVAIGRDTIVSSYPRAAREVRFKFGLNGRDNEFPPGTEHTIYLRPVGGAQVTPVYRFGVESAPPPPDPAAAPQGEEGVARLTIRLDLRHVLRAIRKQGRYTPPNGEPITAVRSAHVIGDPDPLSWDIARARESRTLELTDPDGDGIWAATIPVAAEYTRPRRADGRAIWARTRDLAAFPRLESRQRLQDAVYRLSLEELLQLVREDGALSAGAKWPGVWTRDVSLAAILAAAIVAPDATRRSLMAKVDSSSRIIQDTGTGGSWPVSSDRVVWALAAWELYAVTGDRAWLRTAYDVIRRSAEADLHAVRDPATGLFNGESSFLDWREQSYPRWMQPADIYVSQNLGTNAAHYAAHRVLAEMARALGEPAARWDSVAVGIQAGMTAHLWQPDRGWFGQYRYGRNHLSLSPRAEALGEALASIYGAASPAQRQALVRHAPVTAYGAPTFWPFIPGERFYHNATMWPFVTAYWTWAAAEGGNTTAVQLGLDAATRAVALFLTNKENTVVSTGHFEGTALNSDRQLWSVAGTLAGTYRLLFGMRLEPERLRFAPMVPPSYGGERTLRGFRYRGATLDVTVRGHGTGIRSATLDGRPLDGAAVPASLTGAHRVVIEMDGRWPRAAVNMVDARFAPATPHATLEGGRLRWTAVPGATRYVVHRNARPIVTTSRTALAVAPTLALAEYQVLARDARGVESFLSEPVRVIDSTAVLTAKPTGALEREHAGFTGQGYLRLERTRNTTVRVPVDVPMAGTYAIDVRYANGNGPVNTEDKVGIRTVLVDGRELGVVVLPQRGSGRWSEWGWSNALRVRLPAGRSTVTIAYGPLDENMNRRENTALLDLVRLTPLDVR
ncbi:MAG TPA: hypothetical protein VEA99_15230 [Gemmatimonadaceae bacterium]|nr:hypothetical protein [Gemmatimonadaceae bacterium]